MKKIIVLATMLVSVSSFAMPKVGDYAEFTGTTTRDGKSLPGYLTTEITAFDAATKEYTVKTVYQFQDEGAPTVEESKQTDMPTDATIDSILANCANIQGVTETITVPAGTFTTCKAPSDQEGYVWIGKVPFGVVKLDVVQDGTHILMDLKSFR